MCNDKNCKKKVKATKEGKLYVEGLFTCPEFINMVKQHRNKILGYEPKESKED